MAGRNACPTINLTMDRQKIMIIAGPTASGKTDVAVKVAVAVDGEVVGADSMQIYRHMEIGCAAPTDKQRSGIPHHLIGIIDPDENFTVADWVERAKKLIGEIIARGKAPIVCGGAGLFIRSLLHGIFDAPDSDPELRNKIRGKADGDELYEKLKKNDPAAARKIHPNDIYRIVRALEVFELTGEPISAQWGQWDLPDLYDALKIGLDLPREKLHERINIRAEKMVESGLFDEIHALKGRGYTGDLRPMGHFGYRHMWAHIEGEMSIDRALELMQRDTRRYARRQLTWFRAEDGMEWMHPERDIDRIVELAREHFQS